MNETEPEAPAPGFQLEDAIEILERRKWWIVLGALGGLALGVALYMVLPPRYTASTTILVEPQEVPEDFIRSTITLSIESRLKTLRERVTSYSNLRDLIGTIGHDRLDPTGQLSTEQLMNRIRENLVVELDNRFRDPRAEEAAVFQLAYQDGHPEVVADTAREIASMFVQENVKDREQQATATEQFLDRELERIRERVVAQEKELREFREQHLGELPDQLETNLRTLDRLNNQLALNLSAQEAASQRIAFIRDHLSQGGSAESPWPQAAPPGSVAAALQAARAQLLEAEQIYTDEHPNVVRLREEVAELEERAKSVQAEAAGGETSDPVSAGAQGELAAARLELKQRQDEEQRLRSEIAGLEKKVAKTPQLEQRMQNLTRDYENLMATYRELLSKKQEAALARNLERAQKGERFKVLQPARVPKSPSWPDLTLLAPGGVAAGLGFVALLIGIAEFRNPSFRSVARLRRTLGLPVLASIPKIDNDRIYEEKPSGEVDPRLVVFTAPESAPSEQYRAFTPAFLEDPERRVVLVTSASRSDGKSLTCMNLALTVACDLNRRVLLIDGDLRRPTAHSLVRIGRGAGLSEILRRQAHLTDCAVNSKVPNLTILPAGRSVRNPLALLTDPAFFELIEKARKDYDAVFIDSPPLLPVVDARFLRKMADLVVFVVRADATPRDAVVRSLQELKSVAGVVFNEVSPGSFRRYYYYDAYSRYAYGDPVDDPEADAADAGEMRHG